MYKQVLKYYFNLQIVLITVNEILQTSWIILAIVLIVILIIGVIWLIKQWKKRGNLVSIFLFYSVAIIFFNQ